MSKPKRHIDARQERMEYPTNKLNFKCSDCGEKRTLLQKQLGRAANPRCLACGGCLIEDEQS